MRAAVLLSGEPRFCVEFDYFLKGLKEFDQIDYFVYLWKKSPPTSDFVGSTGHVVIPTFWQDINKDLATEKFSKLLPENHNLCSLELADQESVKVFPITKNFALETNLINPWKMWYGWNKVNQLRIDYEKNNNVNYDLVIKTRPDVALMQDINLKDLKVILANNSNLVIIPSNKSSGYDGIWMCDLFGISLPDTMTIYCDLYNQALEHHDSRGVKFHPETMLGRHLQYHGYRYSQGNFNIEFRRFGIWRDIETGQEWPSTTVPTWFGKSYISDFGRWA